MRKTMKLGKKTIGTKYPCYIIAEIGSNHNRNYDTAIQLIDVAKDAGCDAVKFQSYTADGIYSKYTPRISEMEGRSYEKETPYELIKRIEMPVDWHKPLKEYCDKVNVDFCSSPFDMKMVDVLEAIEVPFYKIASYEITFYSLLEKVAKTGKPVLLSTGNSNMFDIEEAVRVLTENGCEEYVLLHCVSQYPTKYEDMNLRCIKTLRDKFQCLVGLSDHTLDNLSITASLALDCCVVEKHITLDKSFFGPDHPFALEPDELNEMVKTIRLVEAAMGSDQKDVRSSELENHEIGRRSILAAVDLKENDIIEERDLIIKRPALGIHPRHLKEIIGKRVRRNIQKDMWLTWEDIDK